MPPENHTKKNDICDEVATDSPAKFHTRTLHLSEEKHQKISENEKETLQRIRNLENIRKSTAFKLNNYKEHCKSEDVTQNQSEDDDLISGVVADCGLRSGRHEDSYLKPKPERSELGKKDSIKEKAKNKQ